MKRTLVALTLIVAGVSCGPKPERGYVGGAYPTDLTIEVNDKQMALSWRKVGEGSIAGYNIYVSERPLAALYPGGSIDSSVETYNTTPFPGDTIPEDGVEHFDATGLENGVRYYVTVRVVYPDRSVSRPSNEVMAACGPRGEIVLSVRYSGEFDGYSFEQNEYVPADDVDNDLYFWSKDDIDYLVSPRRLSDFINDTRFLVLPYSGIYKEVAARLAESKLTATDDRVEISLGDWVLVSCGRGTHALLRVTELTGSGQNRQVTLFFVYSALVGEMFF